MDRKVLSADLQALATDSNGRSKAALLRDVLPDIEAALAAGVPQAAVLAALRRQGIEMTVNTFKGTLTRLRAQRLKQRSPPPSTPASATASVGTTASPTSALSQGSTDPADLDRIFRSVPDMNALAKAGRQRLKQK